MLCIKCCLSLNIYVQVAALFSMGKKALVGSFKLWINPFLFSSTTYLKIINCPKDLSVNHLFQKFASESNVQTQIFMIFFKLHLKTNLGLCVSLFPFLCSRSWCFSLSLSFCLSATPCIKKWSSLEGGEVLDIKWSSITFYDSEILMNAIY